MARFRFKFAPVLKARKSREEDALRALGAAQGAYQAELAHKRELVDELSKALDRRERLGQIAVTIDAFRTEQDFITGTKSRIIRQDQAIIRASRGVEKALRAYLGARRQTRMLETLYDKHFLEFRKERARKERADLDDLMVMRRRLATLDEEMAGGQEEAS